MAVVHGYRLILRRPVLDRLPDRIVNVHKHRRLERRVAGRERLVVGELEPPLGDDVAGVDPLELFREHWPAIRDGRCERRPQAGPAPATAPPTGRLSSTS